MSLMLFLGSGCGQAPSAREGQAEKTPVAERRVASGPVQTAPAAAAQGPAERELIQQLLSRIEQLEQKDGQRGQSLESIEKAHNAEVEAFQGRIRELEAKVTSLASARVLPEISIPADPSPSTQELDQKIRILERKDELAAEAAETRQQNAPHVSLGQDGFAFSSADSNFVAKLRGVLQLDSRTFFDDNPLSKGNDTFVLRRARPILEGTVFRDIDFQFIPDFGGSTVQIFDANLNYRFRPELQLRAGKFKGPVGLEQLQSDVNLSFSERSLATDLAPTRSVGVELWGDIGEGALNYAVGVFNGSGDARNAGTVDFGDDKEFAGRVFGRPFGRTPSTWLQGFGLGLGGSYSQVSSNNAGLPATTGGTLAGYVTDGQQQFFAYNPAIGPVVADGAHWRLSPQGAYYWGPFGLLGEYVISDQRVLNSASARKADLENTAWEISGQWVLTGEDASFNGIVPERPFRFGGGGWGAWQLAARYGQLKIDDAAFPFFANPATSARSATAWSVGVNWWLNRNLRVMTSFSHTSFDGGGSSNPLDPATQVPPATVTRQDENVLFTRLQLSF